MCCFAQTIIKTDMIFSSISKYMFFKYFLFACIGYIKVTVSPIYLLTWLPYAYKYTQVCFYGLHTQSGKNLKDIRLKF